MNSTSRARQFSADVSVEALGGAVAAIAIGWLGQVPALIGLIGGAVLASRIEWALKWRRRPPPDYRQPTGADGVAAVEPHTGSAGSDTRRRFLSRSSLLITATAVLAVLVSFTLIELTRGESLIGDRDTTFPTPKASEPTVPVPSVIGLSKELAKTRLEAVGFVFGEQGEFSDDVPVGVVIRTEPESGQMAAEGSTVTVFVSRGPGVEVPELPGKSVDEARAELEAVGFVVVEQGEFSDDVPVGVVIRTEPESGQMAAEGSTVTVFVSRGPGVEVPGLPGKSVDEARAELEDVGFVFGEQGEFSDDVPVGVVIRTEPESGQMAAEGSTVTVFVSRGPGVEVPELPGKSVDEARAELEAVGFVVVEQGEFSDDVPEGVVIGSEPPGGAVVDAGAAVNVTVSSGPRFP